MKDIPRNVILDLLPAYLAGELREESKNLVDQFAEHDPEIAAIISKGDLELETVSRKLGAPEDLEVKTIKRVRKSIRRQMIYAALATASILLIPLAAMMFTDEVNWTIADFVVMGLLLLGTGLAYVFLSTVTNSTVYRIAVGIAAAAGFLLIWINLAVGIIGSEDNPANLLYIGVLSLGIIGALAARFRAVGMSNAMFITALAQLLVPVIALIIGNPSLEESPGIVGVFILNAFFAVLFITAGLLFRRAAREEG